MGQYFCTYNLDKKEFIRPHLIDNNLKLMEQVGWEKSTSTALFMLLANSNGRGGGDAKKHKMVGRWAGDRIVVQGDYAVRSDAGYVHHDSDFIDISVDVKDMLDFEFGHDCE